MIINKHTIMKRFYLIPLVVLLLSITSAYAQQAAPQAEEEE